MAARQHLLFVIVQPWVVLAISFSTDLSVLWPLLARRRTIEVSPRCSGIQGLQLTLKPSTEPRGIPLSLSPSLVHRRGLHHDDVC
jgi:hypothetical protein